MPQIRNTAVNSWQIVRDRSSWTFLEHNFLTNLNLCSEFGFEDFEWPKKDIVSKTLNCAGLSPNDGILLTEIEIPKSPNVVARVLAGSTFFNHNQTERLSSCWWFWVLFCSYIYIEGSDASYLELQPWRETWCIVGESGAKPAGGAKPSVVICSAVKCRPQTAIVLISA